MDDEDHKLWRHITQGLKAIENNLFHQKAASKPAAGKDISSSPPSKKPKKVTTAKMPASQSASKKVASSVNIYDSSDIDRSLYQKLTRGRLPIEAVLDLHGMGQEKALDALRRFVPHHAQRGCRMVLVITGKGERLQGLLRQNLPEWLNLSDLKQHILKIAQAQPKDGGAGAYYVLLRRRKT